MRRSTKAIAPRPSPVSVPSAGARRSSLSAGSTIKKINIRAKVYNPDVVIVLDPGLLELLDPSEGMKRRRDSHHQYEEKALRSIVNRCR